MAEFKNSTRAIVWITDANEIYAPPEQPMLGLEVIGDGLALTIAKYEETGTSCTYTTIAEVIVDGSTFLKALLASTDKDTLVWATQLPTPALRGLMHWLAKHADIGSDPDDE